MNSIHYRQHRGFSLLEVLVALVILSVGMLGVLTLQVKGLQFSQSAMTNTHAVNAAGDMADRIRANPGVAASDYNSSFSDGGTMPATLCADIKGTSVNVGCSPTNMGSFDIWQWKDQLKNSSNLPNGEGAIAVTQNAAPATLPFTYTITVRWTERGVTETYQSTIQN